MRIIGGRAKGTNLYTLAGKNTRPTLDRVRESLFNILQNQIAESIFLDLFAGSGACGLEAVSRGAKKAILCDKEKKAIEIIKRNVEKTHLEEKVEIYPIGFEELLKNKLQEKPNITFIDPPYETDFGYKAVKIMLTRNLVDEDSILVIETDQEERLKKHLVKLSKK